MKLLSIKIQTRAAAKQVHDHHAANRHPDQGAPIVRDQRIQRVTCQLMLRIASAVQ